MSEVKTPVEYVRFEHLTAPVIDGGEVKVLYAPLFPFVEKSDK